MTTTYQTIHTTAGIAAMQASELAGVPMNLTHMAVGDGGGSEVTPGVGMTALVHEVYRATISRLEQDAGDPTQYFVELLIPYSIGGWAVREFGVFDDSGTLILVGNFPATYKVLPAEGAASELSIQAVVTMANAGLVTLIIDPAMLTATRSWVTNNITRAALIPGGTTHQVLRKVSNTSGDTEWVDPVAATVLVNTVEETQTASGGQATFTLTTTTTFGLGVFKNGLRIPKIAGADGWQQGVDNVHVVLGTACTGGDKVTFLQNEPAASIPNPLDASLNLSDVASAATSRTNLGVYSKAETDQKAPAGLVAYTAQSTPPAGWVARDGAALSRTVYAALFAAIGTTFGAGDGSTTFNVPDGRGEFDMGWDNGRGIDVGRAFGSWKASQNKAHSHTYTRVGPQSGSGAGLLADTSSGGQVNNYSAYLNSSGGVDAMPRSYAYLAIIKI